MEVIGEKIYRLRKLKGLSQEELAYEIGVSRQTISKWESNIVQPNMENIKALCAIFKVDANYFIEHESVLSENKGNDTNYSQNINSTDKTIAQNNIPNNGNKKLISLIVLTTIFLIAGIILSIILGFTCFTTNIGDSYVTTKNVDKWVAYIIICVTALIFILECVLIFKLIKNGRRS